MNIIAGEMEIIANKFVIYDFNKLLLLILLLFRNAVINLNLFY